MVSRGQDSLRRNEDLDDEFFGGASLAGTDYSGEEDESTVASQVPIDYMDEAEALNGETNMPGLINLNDLLAALNTCVWWIAWIGAILVVGSARAGDADDEDPPPISGPILLGWHGVLDAPDGPTDMGEQRSRQRRRARPHGLDVPTTCRPGPSFQHDNGDSDDGEARRHGLQSVNDGSATCLQQAVITYLHDCDAAKNGKTHIVAADMTDTDEMGAAVDQVARAANVVVEQTRTNENTARPTVLDVQTYCNPGPSFRRHEMAPTVRLVHRVLL